MAKSDFINKVFKSNKSGDFIVIEYNGKDEVWIQFLDTGYILKSWASAIRHGKVKDPFSPRYYNIGHIGLGRFSYKDKKIYNSWVNMLGRCYSGRYQSYQGCTVAEEWHNFQNFAEWLSTQENWGLKNYELDKDIICSTRGKIYSSETCKIVNRRCNIAAIRIQSTNLSGHPGVYVDTLKSGELRFRVTISIDGISTYLGTYLTFNDACDAYNIAKLEYINSKLI